MAKYSAAVDQGTTSTRFMIFDHAGKVVGIDQKEHEQIYPKPGWVEHDANEIWSTQLGVATEAVLKAGLTIHDIAAIGITMRTHAAAETKSRKARDFGPIGLGPIGIVRETVT